MSLNVSTNLLILLNHLVRHQRLHENNVVAADNNASPLPIQNDPVFTVAVVIAPKVLMIGENAQVPMNAPAFRTAAAVP